VVYYHLTMPGAGRQTYKMEEGHRAQEMVERLEVRRTLREYGLEGARREFGVWLSDEEVGLSGKLDLLLRGEGVAAVVDFKLTSGEVRENHRMQLAGYAALVEKVLGIAAPVAFVYRIPDGMVEAVPVTEELRGRVPAAVRAIGRSCRMRRRCGRGARSANMRIIAGMCGDGGPVSAIFAD
jgi:CRISPR/Cas system-associated exonuclease Cas4 (RecB family)